MNESFVGLNMWESSQNAFNQWVNFKWFTLDTSELKNHLLNTLELWFESFFLFELDASDFLNLSIGVLDQVSHHKSFLEESIQHKLMFIWPVSQWFKLSVNSITELSESLVEILTGTSWIWVKIWEENEFNVILQIQVQRWVGLFDLFKFKN